MSGVVSAAGCIILPCAIILDIVGVICLILDVVVGIGEIASFIPDVIGIVFFGFWMLVRSQGEKTYKEAMEDVSGEALEHHRKVRAAGKSFRKGSKRAGRQGIKFFAAMLGELVPLLGALPFWTIFAISELRAEK